MSRHVLFINDLRRKVVEGFLTPGEALTDLDRYLQSHAPQLSGEDAEVLRWHEKDLHDASAQVA